MNYRLFFPLALFLSFHFHSSAQIEINKNFSETKEIKNPKHITLAWANSISSVNKTLKGQKFKQVFQFALDYQEQTDTNFYFRLGIALNATSERITTIRNYYFEPLIFTIGIGKDLLNQTENGQHLFLNTDLFYTQSLKGARLGSGLWQGDNYGFGLEAGVSYVYPFNEQWSLSLELNGGGGFFRGFKNLGTTTQMVMMPKVYSTRPLSIGIRYKFQ